MRKLCHYISEYMGVLVLAALFVCLPSQQVAASYEEEADNCTGALRYTKDFQEKPEAAEKFVVAYVISGTDELPDPFDMTHVNYGFGRISESFDSLYIPNPERLRKIVALKNLNPKLRVLLSIGGDHFSEMAATTERRNRFALNCRRICEDFGLDGIDLDWEFPTSGMAGFSFSPDDTHHFTKMVATIRAAIGEKRLLTMASVCYADYVNFRECISYLDFVNVMAYDMNLGPRTHHSALYPCHVQGFCTSSEAVDLHLKAGVPLDRIVLGMPFYGKGQFSEEEASGTLAVGRQPKDYEYRWDEDGHVPYYVNKEGEFVWGFENTRSLADKCQYILERGVRGAMYWYYGIDTPHRAYSRTIALSLLQEHRRTESEVDVRLGDTITARGALCDVIRRACDVHRLVMDYEEATTTFSSNAPDPEEGILLNLTDGKAATFFHSNWHDNAPETPHHLQADFQNALPGMVFSLVPRATKIPGIDTPEDIWIYATNIDSLGKDVSSSSGQWDKVIHITSGIPVQNDTLFISPRIRFQKPYRYVRFAVNETYGGTKINGYPFFALSEFHVMGLTPSDSSLYATCHEIRIAYDSLETLIEQIHKKMSDGTETQDDVDLLKKAYAKVHQLVNDVQISR